LRIHSSGILSLAAHASTDHIAQGHVQDEAAALHLALLLHLLLLLL
jgi:hypothetical protein